MAVWLYELPMKNMLHFAAYWNVRKSTRLSVSQYAISVLINYIRFKDSKVPPRFEVGLLDSETGVLIVTP